MNGNRRVAIGRFRVQWRDSGSPQKEKRKKMIERVKKELGRASSVKDK